MDTTTAPILLGVGGGLLFISLTLLIARIWSRVRPVVRLHVDDWTILAATILAIANYMLLAAAVLYGLGRRQRFVSFADRRTALKLIFTGQVVWYWSVTLVKLSVGFLLLRIKHTRRWKFFLYTLLTLLVLAAIVQTCFQFLQCRPFSIYWDPRVFRQVKCFDRDVINGNIIAFSTFQIVTDIIYSFIPITFIRKLNLPRREKVFMCVLMALGVFASCAALFRTLTLQTYYTSPDIFRMNVTIALWAIVEQQFALIAATMPTLKSFLEKSLVRIGLFFYDKNTETQVRDRLVQFGLLGEEETLRDVERGTSKLESPTPKKVRDEFGDSMMSSTSDKDVEKMLERSAF
ncbi:hypothetical protein K491DRAFT_611385 [Lophiostoma macrostomum CBS 122681]|uniref:Rhodopsin domain-containing protein n=1 Tax=Lophiostoma macrostomum CBS 122681 TaxID=1314788 RepID=A0A6A6SRZ7_9PLEO|nr:hypothetical protein K491DRAFT_611385 [Lophiostoma macrostomum CBS 122681]